MPPELARIVARLLAGAWRAEPPALELSAGDLSAILPLLAVSGTAPLAWWRVRGTPFAKLPEGQELYRAYVGQVAAGVVREHEILAALSALREAGIEPLLAKGWAVARHYPEPGLRPSADVDLFVEARQLADAERVLGAPDRAALRVDLHGGVPDLPDRTFEELVGRSELVDLAGTAVRVLAPDDHLRLICLHLLRHAAWRPFWFCDVGMMVERYGPDLDWGRLASGSELCSGRVAQVIALSGTLVGARIQGVPWTRVHDPLPGWLEAAIFSHWLAGNVHLYDGVPLAAFLFRPHGIVGALRRRWPSPLVASVNRGAAFDETPRWPLQVADTLVRAVRAALRLPRTLHELLRQERYP